MKVGLLRVALHVPASGSLKHKRRYLQSLKQRIRGKFNVSVAEVGSQDLWQRIDLGVAMVGGDAAYIDQVFTEVVKVIGRQADVDVLEEAREFL
ncbi:MAG TPA: DUF503 domain-containing protein [Firmicutes bacterium]|nr:DUF503 domain-containing protein [Bacillota bacterium]